MSSMLGQICLFCIFGAFWSRFCILERNLTRRHLTLIFSSFFGHSSDRDARFGTYQSYILSNKSQVFLCRAGIGGKAHGGLGGGGGGVLVRLFLIIFAEIIKSETFVDHLRKNPLKYQISCFED